MTDNGKTILLIEDDPGFQRSVADDLGGAGFHVLTASDGKAGLDSALANHPDLIMLDIMLPKMNGLDVLKSLRADGWGKSALIIMLTSLESTDEIMKALMAFEPSFYMVKKGAKLQDIRAKINECLKMK